MACAQTLGMQATDRRPLPLLRVRKYPLVTAKNVEPLTALSGPAVSPWIALPQQRTRPVSRNTPQL